MEENNDFVKSKKIAELMTVPSIGELTARLLIKNGFSDLGSLNDSDEKELSELEGLGEKKIKDIKEELLGSRTEARDISEEIRCPECRVILSISTNICPECETRFSDMEEQVFLPGGVVLEKPLKKLAQYEIEIMEGNSDEDIWFGRAAILESIGAYEAAYESYDKVIEYDPLYEHIWNAKARLAMKLGKMEEATRAYKIAVDFRVEGFPGMETLEDQFGDSEKKVIAEQDQAVDVKEVEEKVSRARYLISRLSSKRIRLRSIRTELEEASKARVEDNREDAVDKAESIINKVGRIEKYLLPILQERSSIEKLPEDSELKERFQQIIDLTDEGDLDKAEKKSKKLIGEFDSLLEKTKKDDKILEEEADEKVVVALENDTSLPKDKEKDVDELIDKARGKLAKARKAKIKIDSIKKDMKNGLKAKKSGEYKKAIKNLERVSLNSDLVLDIFQHVKDSKRLLLKMKEKGLKYEHHLEELKQVKQTADKGDFENAYELADDVFSSIKEEFYDKEKVSYQHKLDKVQKLLDELEEKVPGYEYVRKIIKKAESADEDEKTVNLLEDAENKIDELKDLKKIYNRIEESIDDLPEEYKKELEKGIEKANDGNFESAEEIFFKILKKSTSKNEEYSEEEYKEKVKKSMSDLKGLIVSARGQNIGVEKAGEMINKALISNNNDRYEEAFSFLEKGKVFLLSSMKNKIKESENRINEILDEIEQEHPHIENLVKKANCHLKEGDTAKAFSTMSEALRLAEEEKGPEARLKDKINELKNLLDDSVKLGIEVDEAFSKLEVINSVLDEGKVKEAEEKTQKLQRNVFKRLPDKLKKIIKNAQEEIKEAKLSGKNVSKAIYLLRKVELKENQEDIEKSIKYLKEYQEEMQNMAE